MEYLHGDLTGSTRAVTDGTGAVVGTWDFTAYGEVASSTGDASATRFLFSGEYRDDSGLYYLRARSYDPATGQFLTVDPALVSTGMAYAYTAGDPLQQVDPMGLDSSDSHGGQGVVSGVLNGAKTLWSGVFYVGNPRNWDDIKTSVQCSAEANGGGFGGWFTTGDVYFNPVYSVIDNGDLAIQARKDGRWGDAAEHGTVSVAISVLTVIPIKIAAPKIVAGALRGVAKTVEKIHVPTTAVEVVKGTVASSTAETAPLKLLHSPEALSSAASSAEYWAQQSTERIVESLKPGAPNPLVVDKTGLVWDGNTRIAELISRGYPVDDLPRVTYAPGLPTDYYDTP